MVINKVSSSCERFCEEFNGNEYGEESYDVTVEICISFFFHTQ